MSYSPMSPADVLDQLERLRDFARRVLDMRDLGRNANSAIRRAAAQALHGDECRRIPAKPEKSR